MGYVLQFGEKAHTRVHHQGSRPDVVNTKSGFVSKRQLRQLVQWELPLRLPVAESYVNQQSNCKTQW